MAKLNSVKSNSVISCKIVDADTKVRIKILRFSAKTDSFRDAAILFREAVGNNSPLNDSPLGRKPACAEKLGINLRNHAKMRDFKTEEEFREFRAYLQRLFTASYPNDEVFGAAGDGSEGLVYSTTSGRATIVFERDGEDWSVSGTVRYCNPKIVEANLRRKGFETQVIG